MAEEQIEQPQPEVPETPEKTDIDGIIAALEKANISNPKQLEGKLQNAAGYQKIQSNLSETVKRLDALESENQQLRTQLDTNRNRYDLDEFGSQPNTVDLEDTIARVIKKDREQQQRQALEQQRAHAALYQKITKDRHYKTVEKDFAQKMQDPEVNYRLQTGELNAMELYQDTVLEYYQNTTKQAVEALKALKGSANVAPPHVEDSARVPGPAPDTSTDAQKRVEELAKKAKEGKSLHADERVEMINSQLGDIFR